MLNFPLISTISEEQQQLTGKLDKDRKGITVSTFVSTLRYLLKNECTPIFLKREGKYIQFLIIQPNFKKK